MRYVLLIGQQFKELGEASAPGRGERDGQSEFLSYRNQAGLASATRATRAPGGNTSPGMPCTSHSWIPATSAPFWPGDSAPQTAQSERRDARQPLVRIFGQ